MMTTQNAIDWFKTQFTRLKESVLGPSPTENHTHDALEPEVIGGSSSEPEDADGVNVVEAMLAEVPELSDAARERIRDRFPGGNVCCPIKVARAIQLELLNENPQGEVRFTA